MRPLASHIESFFHALAILVCASGITVRGAVVTAYPDAPSYSAAAGTGLFLIDFNGSPGAVVSGNSISPHVTFGSPEASDPSQVLWNSDALTDAGSTVAANGVGPISLDFTNPVFGFSLNFSSAAEAQTIELYDTAMTFLGSVPAPNASGFFGVVSDTAIDSAIIRPGLFASGNPDRFFIDDLRANAQLPEPSAWFMTIAGLVTLAAARRFRETLSK